MEDETIKAEDKRINVKDNDGLTALFHASGERDALGENYSDVVSYLLSLGADPNVANKAGMTPLMRSSIIENAFTVEFLIDDGRTNINQKNKEGKTALDFAEGQGNQQIIQLLINKGAKKGTTPDVNELMQTFKDLITSLQNLNNLLLTT